MNQLYILSVILVHLGIEADKWRRPSNMNELLLLLHTSSTMSHYHTIASQSYRQTIIAVIFQRNERKNASDIELDVDRRHAPFTGHNEVYARRNVWCANVIKPHIYGGTLCGFIAAYYSISVNWFLVLWVLFAPHEFLSQLFPPL